MLETLGFYKLQLLGGALLGGLCAALGVFVLLKRMSVFGLTLSQASSAAAALTLILFPGKSPIKTDLIPLLLTVILMLPFLYAQLKNPSRLSAILISGMVFFAALSQILLSLGGEARLHLLRSFFGNILTTDLQEILHMLPIALIVILLYIYFYRDFIAVAFDSDHARLTGISALRTDLVFFLMLSYVLLESVKLMGSFYTLTQLIVPPLFALALYRRVSRVILAAILYAVVMTAGGFALSLQPLKIGEKALNLPTSSVIILLMCAGLLVAFLYRAALGFFRSKADDAKG